jgi:hypothetical protein
MLHVWASDRPMLIVGETQEAAERENTLEANRSGHRFPWMLEGPKVWRQLDDVEELTIHDPEPVTKTAGEWARLNGPGLLAFVELLPVPFEGPPPQQPFFRGKKLIRQNLYERN